MTQEFAGARWWKFDFHTHTPFSKDTAWHRMIGGPDALTPEAWLRRFMDAEIDCVAITDHNGSGWIEPLRDAYARMKQEEADGFRDIHLFPGVEISANGGVHVLAIFDPQTSASKIDALLGAVRFGGTPGDSDACSEASIKDVLEAIARAGGIAIPAHVDAGEKGKGLLQVRDDQPNAPRLDAHTLRQVLESGHIYAAERCEANSALPKLYAESRARWTWVLGTDCHSFRGETSRPGARFTWVKMGRPTLQGLRLALLDGSPLSVIRSDDPAAAADPNDHAKAFIESIEIENARHAGRGKPLLARFSPWLSVLIGGRGSGKSTLVEALRWALRRDKEIPAELEDLRQFGRIAKNSEPGGVREDTEFRVVFRKDGTSYRIRWRADGQLDPIEELDESGGWVRSPGEVADRFPVRIYSQKQIFALARDSRALLGIIDESPAVNGAQWRSDLEEAESVFLRLRAESRALRNKLGDRSRLEGELADVVRQLKVFEEGGHKELLQRYQRARRQRRAFDAREQELADVVRKLREASEALVPTDVPRADFDVENPTERSALELLRQASHHQQRQSDDLRRLAEQHDVFARDWSAKVAASDWASNEARVGAEYAALEARLAEQGVKDPAAYGELIQRRQRIEKTLADLGHVQVRIEALEEQAAAELLEVEALRRDLTKRRADFLNCVLEGNRFVRITVRTCGSRAEDAEAEFRNRLMKPAPTFQDDIRPEDGGGLLGRLYSDLGEGRDEELITRLRRLKEELADARGGGESLATKKSFRSHVANMNAELFDRLLLWWPEDDLDIAYRRESGKSEFVPITQGSPGQKSAAILAFILSYGNEPVILDQPEDDLDTHLIYDLIVKHIRTMKAGRQVIIATHNPNIVVNGDAEMVLAMDHRGGQCLVLDDMSGSLQDGGVRDEICRVMEGGKVAFQERYRRVVEEVGRA